MSPDLRDRFIILVAAAPAMIGFAIGLLIAKEPSVWLATGVGCCLLGAGLNLTAPVRAARLRRVRRRYPSEG